MWTVFESRLAEKQLDKAPIEVVRRYEAWRSIVRATGPQDLRAIKGFHDEALKGTRKGERSSRLGAKWRVIYVVDGEALKVLVLEVNAHNY